MLTSKIKRAHLTEVKKNRKTKPRAPSYVVGNRQHVISSVKVMNEVEHLTVK